MREEYDFSNARKNPYVSLKKQISINIDVSTISYFKTLAQQKGIPYQTLINSYLKDCVEHKRELELQWK
ncbi:MAG TPA: antitoxin [Dialister sp.]|nr:antitoxin [Dialister sp.]